MRISRWRDADLLQPIDESRLGNFPELIGSLKKVPDSVVDGERWWVPLDWGKTSVTYRTDMVDMEEESWGLLWDPRYEGRLGMWDDVVDGMAIAPIYMGIDPYRMTPDQVAEVRDLLIEQRPLPALLLQRQARHRAGPGGRRAGRLPSRRPIPT